jgi:hypothetical protein
MRFLLDVACACDDEHVHKHDDGTHQQQFALRECAPRQQQLDALLHKPGRAVLRVHDRDHVTSDRTTRQTHTDRGSKDHRQSHYVMSRAAECRAPLGHETHSERVRAQTCQRIVAARLRFAPATSTAHTATAAIFIVILLIIIVIVTIVTLIITVAMLAIVRARHEHWPPVLARRARTLHQSAEIV